MNSTSKDPRTEIPTLLQTIGREAVTGHGIPTFWEVIDTETAQAIELIASAIGPSPSTTIADLQHDVIAYARAGNQRQAEDAMRELESSFTTQETNRCEAYYLIGVAVTLRAIAQARALANLDITNVLTALIAKDREEGGDRG